MPSDTINRRGHRVTLEYVGERALLNFANKIRQAGGANILKALMPSEPGDASACLIANALNFGCEVMPADEPYLDEYGYVSTRDAFKDDKKIDRVWVMVLPSNMDNDRVRELAKAIKCKVRRGGGLVKAKDSGWDREVDEYVLNPKGDRLIIELPRKIGNAAEVFDAQIRSSWTFKYDSGH